RRLTMRIPVGEDAERIRVGQRKSACEATADAERMEIAMLSRDCWRHRREIAARSVDHIPCSPNRHDCGGRSRRWRCGEGGRNIRRCVAAIEASVLDRDEVTGLVLVVDKARKARRLRARRCRRIGMKLTREVLLQRL